MRVFSAIACLFGIVAVSIFLTSAGCACSLILGYFSSW